MFEKGIETAAGFTRAIHTVCRNHKSEVIQPGAATLFFVNPEGWALTCGHVADLLAASHQLGERRRAFRAELQAGLGQGKKRALERELERKHGFSRQKPFEVLNRFFNCVEGGLANVHFIRRKELDVALLHFTEFDRLLCDSFPVFSSDDRPKQGKLLCRLGFPFPEFQNYEYDKAAGEVRWTEAGRRDTPRFPIEGMVTRHLLDGSGNRVGFEMSTPGLRGQSGGPAFDAAGLVWGMQSSTNHLDLDFDVVEQEVLRNGQRKRVSASTFLHVGHCMDVGVLKSFMREHGVQFQETGQAPGAEQTRAGCPTPSPEGVSRGEPNQKPV